MAPKPASTAGKAPASTASKAPAKPAEGAKAAKKTSKPAASGEEKKKRKKVRKETYSSYIYKGEWRIELGNRARSDSDIQSSSRSTPILVSPTRRWPFSTPSSTTSSSVSPLKLPVRAIASFNVPCRGLTASFPLAELAAYSKKSTISSREIQTAVRLILPGELAKHAISEGTKSVTSTCPLFHLRAALELIVLCRVLVCWCQVIAFHVLYFYHLSAVVLVSVYLFNFTLALILSAYGVPPVLVLSFLD